jgi:hypothetical protein
MKNLFSGFNFSFSAWTWQAGKTAGLGNLDWEKDITGY